MGSQQPTGGDCWCEFVHDLSRDGTPEPEEARESDRDDLSDHIRGDTSAPLATPTPSEGDPSAPLTPDNPRENVQFLVTRSPTPSPEREPTPLPGDAVTDADSPCAIRPIAAAAMTEEERLAYSGPWTADTNELIAQASVAALVPVPVEVGS